MDTAPNTLFLRLAGPMQSWATSSALQIRRTDAYPSKSGVLGLLLCAKGIDRQGSAMELLRLCELRMGVRVDRPGTLDWDYHTAGANEGIRRADTGKPKKTESTGKLEAQLSRRQYLCDASFLVALQGAPSTVEECAASLKDPVWPVFLGRKSCVPAEPVFADTGAFGTLKDALSSKPWQPRVEGIDRSDRSETCTLAVFIEHPLGTLAPADARLVHDVPRGFGFYNHGPRWVVPGTTTVSVGTATQPRRQTRWRDPYGPEWEALRLERLKVDNDLCVFCKSPASDVHHVDYSVVRIETLRSLCRECHLTCTSLEYGHDMRERRIDPSDPAQRPMILEQIHRRNREGRAIRREELLAGARSARVDFFNETLDLTAERA